MFQKLKNELELDYNAAVVQSVLGTVQPEILYSALQQYTRAKLNQEITDLLFLEASVGLGIGLELADGRRIFAKILGKDSTLEELHSIESVLNYLREKNFPCPTPIGSAESLLEGRISLQSYEKEGESLDGHNPDVYSLQAWKLHELHCLLEEYKGPMSFAYKSIDPGRPWIKPHSALFDFDNSEEGAQWIYEKAMESKKVIEGSTKGNILLSHTDWSNKHFRFNNGRIVMVYDWDSLQLVDELYSLGIACSTFTATWDFDTRIIPTPEEAKSFVMEYQRHRSIDFSAEEIRVISAYAANTISYMVRCMHAFNPNDLYGSYFEKTLLEISEGLFF